MPIPLREAAKILGIHYKTLEKYIKQGFLHPETTITANKLRQYLFSPADIDRARQIYAHHQLNVRLKHPNLADWQQKTREKALSRHGQHTNRVGRAPVSTGTRGVLSHQG